MPCTNRKVGTKVNKVIKKGVGKYTTDKGHTAGVEVMPTIKTKSGLSITYHNPNTPEEMTKILIEMVGESMYKKITEKEIDTTKDTEGVEM